MNFLGNDVVHDVLKYFPNKKFSFNENNSKYLQNLTQTFGKFKKHGSGVYINLDQYKPIGTHWINLHVNGNNAKCFDSFGVKYIPKEIKKLIGNKNS